MLSNKDEAPLMGKKPATKEWMGHSLKDWFTLFILTCITIVLLIILAVVLPKFGPHPCQMDATNLISRMSVLDRSKVWERTQYIAEGYGSRVNGDRPLEQMIDYVVAEMRRDNLTVAKEAVVVPKWSRGTEYAFLTTSGTERPVQVLGLVGSVGANFTADFVVVNSTEALKSVVATGKLVVFNTIWVDSASAKTVERTGASLAAQAGAIGCLIRSTTPFSLGTMHVGVVQYALGVEKIPCASITAEEADTLQGLYDRKRAATVTLWLDEQEELNATSYNIVATLTGGDKKDEFVVVGAHIDTLELGQGVQNSLAGFVMAWEGLRIMKYHQMVPLRSIRLVGWTGSELGHVGAEVFSSTHAGTTVFALEANQGASKVTGIIASTWDEDTLEVLEDIGDVLSDKDATEVTSVAAQPNTNINPLFLAGVAVASFKTEEGENQYWWYADSEADNIGTTNQDALLENGGIMAAYTYCIANSEETINKKPV